MICLFENVKQLLAFLVKPQHIILTLYEPFVLWVDIRQEVISSAIFMWSFSESVCVKDLEQSVEEDNAGELVLGVSLPDNEGQCDGGRQFITAVRLRQAGLPAGHTGHFYSIRHTLTAAKHTRILNTRSDLMNKR